MLDRKTEIILKYLSNTIGTNFTVVTKTDLIDALAKKASVDDVQLDSSLNYLKENNYITVKYQDSAEICLAVTMKSAAYLEHKSSEATKAELTKKQHAYVFLYGALGAFVGAFLAVLLHGLIF
ncbi:MAG: hypothetical protein NC350_06480 [Corallococcus sp.]|nr:hypothetical protein [Corallococcus sp.]